MAAEWDLDKEILARFYPDYRQRVIIDVGAADPEYLSFSNKFRSLGWKVITIEPNPFFCNAHRERGYNVYEFACSDEDKDDVDFFLVDSKGYKYMGGEVSYESFSSLGITDQFEQLHNTVSGRTSVNKIKVNTRKLDTILAQNEPEINKIDVISVDVEGWEIAVMKGLDTDKYKPDVIVLENLFDDDAYRTYMNAKGYYLCGAAGHNEVYHRKP